MAWLNKCKANEALAYIAARKNIQNKICNMGATVQWMYSHIPGKLLSKLSTLLLSLPLVVPNVNVIEPNIMLLSQMLYY